MFYIVGTPIGNIEDISLRAVKTLVNSDIILSEDTRSFSNLYNRVQTLFSLHPKKNQKVISFYKEVEFEKMPQIIKWLEEGYDISLVSESGMPLISDPGNVLVSHLRSLNTPFTVIPGPTAFVNAAVLSGFSTKQILFLGFLPKKENEITKVFKSLEKSISKHINPTIIFYESPHRIQETLKLISKKFSKSKVSVVREMTKMFEEVLNLEATKKESIKGELTVVMQF